MWVGVLVLRRGEREKEEMERPRQNTSGAGNNAPA